MQHLVVHFKSENKLCLVADFNKHFPTLMKTLTSSFEQHTTI